jgi:hypothetical protein
MKIDNEEKKISTNAICAEWLPSKHVSDTLAREKKNGE